MKDPMERMEKQSITVKKYFQTTCSAEDKHLKYIKKPHNLTVEQQEIQLGNGQKVYADISPKMAY